MNCKWAEERVVDYLYDELSTEERKVFEQHLAECPEHAREVEASRKILGLMRAEDEIAREDAPALTASVFQAARERSTAKPAQVIRPAFWQRWALRPTAMAAVLAMVLVGVALSVGIWPKSEPGMMTEQARPAEVMKAIAPVQVQNEQQAAAGPRSASSTDGFNRESTDQPKRPATAQPLVAGLEGRPRLMDAEKARPGEAKRRARKYRKKPRSKAAKKKASGMPAGKLDGSPSLSRLQDKDTRTVMSKGQLDSMGGGGAARGRLDHFAIAQNEEAKNKEAEKTSEKPKPARLEESESSGFAQAPPPPAPVPDAASSGEKDGDKVRVATDARLRSGATAVVSKPRDSKHDTAGADLVDNKKTALAQTMAEDDELLGGEPKKKPAKDAKPVSADTLYRRARKLFLQNRCKQAQRMARAALRANPRHSWAEDTLLDMASCHVKQGDFDKARKIYRQVINEYPTRADDAQRALKRLGS
ncbi:MAG: zf-HC2 domain-containing protein [Deltaproteobacteria bacterium]|nr:zf-HC2 domain-containing protein [Deltaproteobacteria bacterium]